MLFSVFWDDLVPACLGALISNIITYDEWLPFRAPTQSRFRKFDVIAKGEEDAHARKAGGSYP